MSNEIDPHEETRAEAGRPTTMAAGSPIGSYELREVLGEGGMGVVWRAHDPKLDREVAIKVLKRMDAPVSLRQRLQREARAMARLKHPNVLTIYDSGTAGGRDFIAMELVDGCSLDVWLERHPLPEDVIAAVLAAGRGLAAAHRAGLVHRDFKPHNILRSKDGRVLVTDFGLARGLGDDSQAEAQAQLLLASRAEAALDETLPPGEGSPTSSIPPRTDSVLDSPLTQTGVLIGTPAYMAPEQFHGAAPDPRTDQFAFCVTAWQMLTGGRPYHGASLDELRQAASEGVGHVKSTLPPRVRGALVRGMDPDPAKRWPDMDALLDELEAATRRERPRWLVPAIAAAMIAALVLVALIARRGGRTDAVARVCEPADVAFGDAWSPAVRAQLGAELAARGVGDAAWARVADPFDAWRTAWMQSYDEACRAPPDKLPKARLACLASARDTVGALQLVLREGPPGSDTAADHPTRPAGGDEARSTAAGSAELIANFDPHGMLPNIAACAGPNPPSSPQIPIAQRSQILALMAKAFTLRGQRDVAAAADALLASARQTGWAPLVPMIMLSEGNELLRRGDLAAARAVYEEGTKLARSDLRLLASLRLGILEAAIGELKAPDTPIRPGELPAEIAAMLDAARATARTAGGDRIFMASAALLEGQARAARARWTFDKRLFADAVAAMQEARRLFVEAGDLRRAALVAANEAELYLLRADERALDDAMFVARSAEEALEQAKLPRVAALDAVQARIAFVRGDYGEARTRYARLPAPPAPAVLAPAVTGTVVDPVGKPVGEATVIAWVGELDGDPQNLVTDEHGLEGEIVQTASDGTFTLHAPAGAAIVAQRGTLRSVAVPVATGPMKLELLPTTVSSGLVEGRNLGGVIAFAQFAIGEARWRIRAPVHRDGSYAIGGQPRPATPPIIGALAEVDDGVRTVLSVGPPLQLVWPHGRALEVIVRGELREGARIWVWPGQLHAEAPRTRGDVEILAHASTNIATAVPHAIGATATPRGRELYRRGDHHAVLVGNAHASVVACVAPDDQPTTALTCADAELAPGEVTDLPDGRWGSDPQPLLIEIAAQR